LLGYEREFRKIAAEVGGTDVLGQLEELDGLDDSLKKQPVEEPQPSHSKLSSVAEEPTPSHHASNEWEMDPDQQRLGDEDDDFNLHTYAHSRLPLFRHLQPFQSKHKSTGRPQQRRVEGFVL